MKNLGITRKDEVLVVRLIQGNLAKLLFLELLISRREAWGLTGREDWSFSKRLRSVKEKDPGGSWGVERAIFVCFLGTPVQKRQHRRGEFVSLT